MTTKFEFPTPPLVRAANVMMHIIASGAPSCAFFAFPRFGKTRAITYCRERLPEVFPSVPIFTFHAHHEKAPTARSFFSDLLTQSGYVAKRSAKPRELREQLVRAWWVEAQSRDAASIILLGDEMQRLGADEYTYLIDVSNDLHELGVRLTSILFGQPELKDLRTTLRATHRGDILGRFMSRLFAFDGISSAKELQQVFSCYDDPHQAEYPEGSGCCYTQFFLPHAFESGWRLASVAQACWDRFAAHATSQLQASASRKLSLGMEWIAGTVQYVFTHFGDLDCAEFLLTMEEWDVAIESTGFSDTLGWTYHPDWVTRV